MHDRESWAKDIDDIMKDLDIPKTKQNVCSIVAVVEESNFVANPQVPGLGQKRLRKSVHV